MLDLSVIVPVRNAEQFIEECLDSITHAAPREIIVVDGNSTDRTAELAQHYPVKFLSDGGRGVAAARMLGVRSATSDNVALVDVDIVLPEGTLARLFDEFQAGHYSALQAGLLSTAGPGYWGQALVSHHNNGRSKHWPGVMATIFNRDVLLQHGLDETFASGEDIELRWRLQRANTKLGVSRESIVTHRFDDTFSCARGQFVADGEGLARMVLKYGWRAAPLAAIPAAGSARGVILTMLRRNPRWLPYYVVYAVYNYVAMLGILAKGLRRSSSPQEPNVDFGRP